MSRLLVDVHRPHNISATKASKHNANGATVSKDHDQISNPYSMVTWLQVCFRSKVCLFKARSCLRDSLDSFVLAIQLACGHYPLN